LKTLDKHGCFSWKNVFGPPQNHGCGQKKPEGTSSAMFGIGTAAKCNSSHLPTEFTGGDQLSVPCAVPNMSALPNDWFRFFFCYSYGSQLFGLEHNKDPTKMKSSQANFVTEFF